MVERLRCQQYGPGSNTGSGSPAVGPTQGVKLTTHLHLLPRLRVTGAKSLLPLCVFMPCTRKLYLNLVKSVVKYSLPIHFFGKFYFGYISRVLSRLDVLTCALWLDLWFRRPGRNLLPRLYTVKTICGLSRLEIIHAY